MEFFSLTWSYILENRKVLVVGMTQRGSPVIQLRTLDSKSEFFLILADWYLIVERFPALQQYFQKDMRSKKRKTIELEDIKVSGTHFDLITQGTSMELSYKSNWLDDLLSRPPLKFTLSGNEVLALVQLQPQIQHSLELMRRPHAAAAAEHQQLILTGNEDNLEELLNYLIPKNRNRTHHPHHLPEV